MILKKVLDLKKSIGDYRRDMNKLVINKDISHPDFLKISNQLDEELSVLQKMIYEIRSPQI
ncbi:Spo0E family sporulation regulatory protein-aspartic acid phosphatase [Peribacillus simplex]|uniref:Spo0E family sporulation regulatory protein-aspartic acid phosphatase n=1 Tax=Peribacillus simplex TaxID=1478 RepID=UPI0036721E67